MTSDQIHVLTSRTHDLEEQLATALRDLEQALQDAGNYRRLWQDEQQHVRDQAKLLDRAEAEIARLAIQLGDTAQQRPAPRWLPAQPARDLSNAVAAEARARALRAENRLAEVEGRDVVGSPA